MLFAVSCVLESQTITQSLLPHISERFIYSCKSYFKWLTSKLLVYRAKWGAASPFQSSPLFSFLLLLLFFPLSLKLSCRVRQTWSLWECEPSVKWEEVWEVSFFIFSSRHFASFKGGEKLCIVVVMTLLFNIHFAHELLISTCLLKPDEVHENAFLQPGAQLHETCHGMGRVVIT